MFKSNTVDITFDTFQLMRKAKGYRSKGSRTRRFSRRDKSKSLSIKQPISLKDEVKKVGFKNDLIFKDTDSYQTYAWTRLSEGTHGNANTLRGKLHSLQDICAVTLANNVDMMVEEDLDIAPWSCWSKVWKCVLRLGKDSPHAFSLFASRFSCVAGFQSHMASKTGSAESRLVTKSSERYKVLSSRLIPRMNTHRMDNLFSNIRMLDFVRYLGKLSFMPFVVLDLSRVVNNLSNDDLLLVFNIPNLIALDVSCCIHLDDLFINNLVNAIMKDGKLTKLSILKITNCPKISKSAIRKLMDTTKNDTTYLSLSYLETDYEFLTDDFFVRFKSVNDIPYVEDSSWLKLDIEDKLIQTLHKSPMALKLHIIYKHFADRIVSKDSSEEPSIAVATTNSTHYLYQARKKLIWDFMITDDKFNEDNDYDSFCHQIENAWSRRLSQGTSNTHKTNCYLRDINKVVSSLTFEPTAPKRQKLSKPRINPKSKNVQSFFGL